MVSAANREELNLICRATGEARIVTPVSTRFGVESSRGWTDLAWSGLLTRQQALAGAAGIDLGAQPWSQHSGVGTAAGLASNVAGKTTNVARSSHASRRPVCLVRCIRVIIGKMSAKVHTICNMLIINDLY